MIAETSLNARIPPAWQPLVQQQVFRSLLTAFAYPGRIAVLPEGQALLHTLAALIDSETSLADVTGQIAEDDLRRLAARPATPETARFVVADGAAAPGFTPCLGSLDSPEYGATLIVRVAKIGEGTALQLAGPGIAKTQRVQINGLHSAWLSARAEWNAGFPLGVDFLFVAADQAVALPRTTGIVEGGH
ncbi:MAG: phosphonate C-P lyase system protein PhnH [Zoogloeaceae bacterium]|jgi:alpha-D-ribose 1-methylphosphonate 5-triphosphate synthase subunit PhnH|nr:phosphonate C-P lyase system protein PhnH [Zoogloeaceae bacterium]